MNNFVIASVTTVLYVTSPPGTMVPDARGYLDELQETTVNVPFNTLIPTLINLCSPVIIKILVKLEKWDSPETAIQQKIREELGRIIRPWLDFANRHFSHAQTAGPLAPGQVA